MDGAGGGAPGGGAVPEPGGSRLGFRTVDRTTVYSGWLVSVTRGRYADPEGAIFERDVVHHPGAVAVIPVTDRGTAVLLRQYRAPFDTEILEAPAGTRDVAGEEPAAAARRELAEEVGLTAEHLEVLATSLNSPGWTDQSTVLYLASGLRPCASQRHGPEEQWAETVEVALADVPARIADGTLTDATTMLGLLLARERQGRR